MLRRYRWLAIALALVVFSGAALMLYQHWVVTPATSQATRLMPLLCDVGLYAVVALLPVSLALLVVLVLRARSAVDQRPLRRRVLSTLLATVIAAAICAATGTGLLATHPDFPLGPSLVTSQASPDGKQVAYLYRYFLGSLSVFKRQAGHVTLRYDHTFRNPVRSSQPQLRWSADGKVQIVDPAGQPLKKGRPWNFGLGPR